MNVSPETTRWLLAHAIKIRRFEETLKRIHQQKVPGMVHLYIGEEAVAVGVCAHLRPSDKITSTHRGHGHAIAKGADVKLMMAELFGKATGYCKGKGGSMHVADAGLGILGANGIVGGGLTLATGAGLAMKMQGQGGVAVCFFGDGAANQGMFHESLNLAKVWNLPVIYVCENNMYHEFSPSKDVTAATIAGRAAGYDIPGITADGMDVLAMHAAAGEAIERARVGGGPSLIEAQTYRFEGHDEGEFALIGTRYRADDELAAWVARDPIAQLTAWALDAGHVSNDDVAAIEQQIADELEAAIAFADASPLPTPEAAFEHVFAD
ncbi:MAG: thiamine pyrophosphate-dependent dehydrogenase E1 component subunit alpha [Chloroflexales bacterium]|nr:thiamine pyrophosphate-dependent dehydrogenase E1 component subunit alpha [Chloroflexales bacterium]